MRAIILAAGEGTRLRPLTSTRPKPMLPIAGKPILEWDLEALSGRIDEATIVVGYKKDKIIGYFGSSFKGIDIDYVEQKEHLGTAHAVSIAKEHAKGEFLVMNGDLMVSSQLIDDLLNQHKKHKPSASLTLTEAENPSQFGVVELKGNIVKRIHEKPKRPKSNLINAGIYIFDERIFDAICSIRKLARMEYEITDAITKLIPGNMVHGFRCKGRWMDIGRPWDLLDANDIILHDIKLSVSKEATIEEFAVIKGGVHVGKGTTIKSGSYIEGPCYIGDNCVIGPNAYIRQNTSLGDNVHIGNAVEVKNTTVMSGTNICHLSYVGDSIIGERCNFSAGTKAANLRFDDKEVTVRIKNDMRASGRRKFGTIIGDNVKTGINVSIMPGIAIYPGAWVEAGSVVRNTIFTEEL